MEVLDVLRKTFFNNISLNAKTYSALRAKGLHRGELNTRARVLVGAPGRQGRDHERQGRDQERQGRDPENQGRDHERQGRDHERQRMRP